MEIASLIFGGAIPNLFNNKTPEAVSNEDYGTSLGKVLNTRLVKRGNSNRRRKLYKPESLSCRFEELCPSPLSSEMICSE